MFDMTPEGRNRVDRNDAVRQTVPEFGSSNRESPATDSRQLDWWHYKTAGVSRTKTASTRLISDADKWSKVSWRASMQKRKGLNLNFRIRKSPVGKCSHEILKIALISQVVRWPQIYRLLYFIKQKKLIFWNCCIVLHYFENFFWVID